MDPVTAFGLVASVLQVTSVSLNVVSRCHEMWKDGSLAQHQDTQDMTKRLCEDYSHKFSAVIDTDRLS